VPQGAQIEAQSTLKMTFAQVFEVKMRKDRVLDFAKNQKAGAPPP